MSNLTVAMSGMRRESPPKYPPFDEGPARTAQYCQTHERASAQYRLSLLSYGKRAFRNSACWAWRAMPARG